MLKNNQPTARFCCLWLNSNTVFASFSKISPVFYICISLLIAPYSVMAAAPDDDMDGVLNNKDACPLDPAETVDTDNDTICNNADPDDDNDSMPDSFEISYGLNPLDASDASIDTDGDTYDNLSEFRAGTDPQDVNVNPGTVEHLYYKILANDGEIEDRFGLRVSLSDDTALIGARHDDDNGIDSGSAYVYVRDASGQWIQQAKLIASDGAAGDLFGFSLSLSGDTALVGAYQDDDNGVDSGSTYVYVRDASGNWSQQAKLLASDGAAGDFFFGVSVSLSGDTAQLERLTMTIMGPIQVQPMCMYATPVATGRSKQNFLPVMVRLEIHLGVVSFYQESPL